MPIIEKEVIRPGQYFYKEESTGEPRKLVVTPELTKYWNDQGNAMLAAGLTIPIPLEHDFDSHPMSPADKLKNNAGWVGSYRLKDIKDKDGKDVKDVLFSTCDITDADIAKKLPHTIRWTSPWINSFTDGSGKEWRNVISHLALTTRPRVVNQQPFGSIAAALSMASETTVANIADKGVCLSRAGLLNGDVPAYPIAFSIMSGISFGADASGHEHDESGKFGKGSGIKKKLTEKVGHRELIDRAEEHTKAGRHDQAAIHYMAAAEHLRSFGAHEAAGSMDEEAKKSAKKHFSKDDASMALGGDFPPKKGKPKPGEQPPPEEVVDDDNPNEDDIESNDDLNDDGTPDILEDANGDIAMEELLCDLLQALGVPMPDESNEQEFKRHLYEAVMSKIKELTSKGLKDEEDQNDPTKNPDQNKPPNQNPNTSHPSKAPNPLIQQEQQPMYMSLEDINKIPDVTMKNIAMSMYNENVKLRAELDAGAKVANSLRDSKLKEENAKRTSRVTLLGRLSPRVKADLDAMLALPAMALSMGDGGVVMDPMETTLAVLEKGLSDLPRLLTTERTALSQHDHPSDESVMSDARADEIAEGFSRQMGNAPQERKAS